MSELSLLHVDKVEKKYTRGFFNKQTTFYLQADFVFEDAGIVGVMGANGAGKTTLFEMIAGTTQPSSGRIYCQGYDIQNVKYKHRDRLAIHYHQSYQVRNIQWTRPEFAMQPCSFDYPSVHLFDEPQFNTQDGYIPFMLQYFRQLHTMRCLVFISVHPTEVFQLQIVRNVCQKFMFVHQGQITQYATWEDFTRQDTVRDYLGDTLLEYESEESFA